MLIMIELGPCHLGSWRNYWALLNLFKQSTKYKPHMTYYAPSELHVYRNFSRQDPQEQSYLKHACTASHPLSLHFAAFFLHRFTTCRWCVHAVPRRPWHVRHRTGLKTRAMTSVLVVPTSICQSDLFKLANHPGCKT